MKVKNVKTYHLKTNGDNRGLLTSIEQMEDIPFEITRVYFMHHITNDRGGHAHIETDQLIIAISGSFKLKVFDGNDEAEYFLNDCTKGIFTPRLTFCDLYDFSEDAICLVLANTSYNMSKSLRTKEEFLKFIYKNQQ